MIKEYPASPRYTVSDDGKVFGVNGGELKTYPSKQGYIKVTIRIDGKPRSRKVHRMVLETFMGPCPPEMEGCHKNDDKLNNSLSNLRWDTRESNVLERHLRERARLQCPQGHRYTDVNTYIDPKGRRRCRACKARWRKGKTPSDISTSGEREGDVEGGRS